MLAGYGDIGESMTFRVTASGRMGGGEQWQNVWHFNGAWDDDPGGAGDAFDALTTFYDSLTDRLYDGWHLDRLAAADVGEATTREDLVTGVDGTVTGAPMPNDCSILTVWLSDNPSRTGRGRTFLGGWPITACVANGAKGAGVVDGGPVGGIAAAATALLADISVQPVVWSRPNPDAGRPVGSESPITGGYVSRRWSTQRRRDLETPRSIVTFP